MNGSLILTKQCNLRCRYCFETHDNGRMSEDTALRALDLLVGDGAKRCGVSFFGGEPLLRKDLIMRCVTYAEEELRGTAFRWNMTTNGLLLDEDFLQFAGEHHLQIAMSHDGAMSRVNRLHPDGKDCLAMLDQKLALLLRFQPDAFIMATASPETVGMAADSVIGLFHAGVKRLNLAIDSRPDAGWNDDSMAELGQQLEKIADFVFSEFSAGRDVFFNGLEEKILAITKEKPCHVCRLGMRKLYIDWDGAIYPCIQFGGVREYRLGDVRGGLDEKKRQDVYRRSLTKPAFCEGCALQSRCVNDCACLNYQQCGEMGEVSAQQCAFQRAMIPCADDMARRMLAADEAHFIRRYMKK